MAYESFADVYGPVEITGGLIRGIHNDGVYTFKNIKYAEAERFPDFGSGKGDNPVALATNQVCEEFGILSTKEALKRTGREMVHIHQPGEATYLKRIN